LKEGGTVRLFIALNLSEKQKKELHNLQQRLQAYLEGVKWVGPQGMHLTLKFLGEVEESRIIRIRDAIQSVADSSASFRCTFGGSGVFPAVQKPRVLWVGLREGSDAVHTFVSNLDSVLLSEGFSAETTRFTPHLTLGRLRYPLPPDKIKKFLEEERTFSTDTKLMDAVTLYLSKLSRHGATYTALHEIKLG
jgi:RNA 2',3'-cyclic 3'-phosphodiesterase